MVGRPENESDKLRAIRSAGRAIASLHSPLGATQNGDWLDEHEEPGQSFEEYRHSDPVLPTKVRTTMYLQPLGDFDPTQAAAIEATAELLGTFYGVPVRMLDEMKIWWASRVDPADRYRRLADFAATHGLEREAEFWRTSERTVRDNIHPSGSSS
jgi:hypothetical protein